MSSSSGKTFTLRSEDGEEFEVEEAVVTQSGTLKLAIENREANDTILVPKVTGETLSKVIEYCKKHAETGDRSTDDEIKAWDANFIKLEQSTLYGLLMAAKYLDVKELIELVYQGIDDMIEGLSTEEFRSLFKIQGR